MDTWSSWRSCLYRFQEASCYFNKALSTVSTIYDATFSGHATKLKGRNFSKYEIDSTRGGYLRYEKYIQQHHSKFDAMIQVVSALDNCGDSDVDCSCSLLMLYLGGSCEHRLQPDQTDVEKGEDVVSNDLVDHDHREINCRDRSVPGLQLTKQVVSTQSPDTDPYNASTRSVLLFRTRAQLNNRHEQSWAISISIVSAPRNRFAGYAPRCLDLLGSASKRTSRWSFLESPLVYALAFGDCFDAQHRPHLLLLDSASRNHDAKNQIPSGARYHRLTIHSKHCHSTSFLFPWLGWSNFSRGTLRFRVWSRSLLCHPVPLAVLITIACYSHQPGPCLKATLPSIPLASRMGLYILQDHSAIKIFSFIAFHGARPNRVGYRTYASGAHGSGLSSGQGGFSLGPNAQSGGGFIPGAHDPGGETNRSNGNTMLDREALFEELYLMFFMEASARGYYICLVPIQPVGSGAQFFAQHSFPIPPPVPLPTSVQRDNEPSTFQMGRDMEAERAGTFLSDLAPEPDPRYLNQIIDAPLTESNIPTAPSGDWATQSPIFTQPADQASIPTSDSLGDLQPPSVAADPGSQQSNSALAQQTEPILNEGVPMPTIATTFTDSDTSGSSEPAATARCRRPGRKAANKTCLECKRTFSRNYELDDHMYYHTGVKRHECPKCGKRFRTRANMSRHRDQVDCV